MLAAEKTERRQMMMDRPWLLGLGATLVMGGCGGAAPVTFGDGGTEDGGPPAIARVTTGGIDKIDLVLMIDNSRSMADKQLILGAAVPDLVRGLVNPRCVDAQGQPGPAQPAGPLESCAAGTKREFPPIVDIHVGVVTSSLGGHGADVCAGAEMFSCPGGATNTSNNDAGHLVSRLDPCNGGLVTTYQGKGFLAWDPTGKAAPPGEASIGAINVDPSTGQLSTATPGLVPSLKDLVLGAGQVGCGYESSLEAWYRFLVDPEPYQTLTLDAAGHALLQGVDDVLLQQRRDFLRPSSLLAIVGLTDENDCSIQESGQSYLVAQQRDPSNPNKNFHLPPARSECATNPNDPCCRSCGQDQSGCPADPACAGALDAKTDDVNLRCWDQKRRFGVDFLYPIDRYVTALTGTTVPNRQGSMVQNPIYTNLNPGGGDLGVRDPSMVFVAYVVGVPWQDIARDPGDLKKGFKSASQLAMVDIMGHTTWDYIIGDPVNHVPPGDPHMIESTSPRTGASPITGDALAPPSTSPGPGPDKMSGHEYTPGTQNGVQVAPDDLEYACIFPLPQPRDCSAPGAGSCDCTDPKNDNPLCEPDPQKGGNRTLQARAKGYPGIRQLQLVKALGTQGILGSICPAQLTDLTAADFGYRPAIGALIDRLKPLIDGGCLPRKLVVASNGQVDCTMIEARNTGNHLDAAGCASLCAAQPGRAPVSAASAFLVTAAENDPIAQASGWDCFCEMPQLAGPSSPSCQSIGSPLAACQCDPTAVPSFGGKEVDGWCYVDAANTPPTGNPELVTQCPDTEKRVLRFVGAGNPSPGGTVFIGCR
jgi:hypothetical protein